MRDTRKSFDRPTSRCREGPNDYHRGMTDHDTKSNEHFGRWEWRAVQRSLYCTLSKDIPLAPKTDIIPKVGREQVRKSRIWTKSRFSGSGPGAEADADRQQAPGV